MIPEVNGQDIGMIVKATKLKNEALLISEPRFAYFMLLYTNKLYLYHK